MAGFLFDGDCIGHAVGPEVGKKKGAWIVRIEMEVTDGIHKGRRVSYEGKLDEQNIKFTKKAMLAVGWKGVTVATFVDDVKAANLTVPFKVEIASWRPPPEDGRPLQQWSTVKYIGGAAKPLDKPDAAGLHSLDKWLADAGDVGPSASASSNGTGRPDGLPF